MSVSGSFDALNVMVRKIEAIAGKGPQAAEFKLGLLKNCAEAARFELDEQFNAARNPYGVPWVPLTSRDGKPLSNTGALASSFGQQFQLTETGFSVSTAFAGAAAQNYGAVIRPVDAKALRFKMHGRYVFRRKVTIPRRQMVPESSTGGMGTWGTAINVEADAYMRKFVKET